VWAKAEESTTMQKNAAAVHSRSTSRFIAAVQRGRERLQVRDEPAEAA
jgi:hypothetical protein